MNWQVKTGPPRVHDLFEAIERKDHPTWTAYLQIMDPLNRNVEFTNLEVEVFARFSGDLAQRIKHGVNLKQQSRASRRYVSEMNF